MRSENDLSFAENEFRQSQVYTVKLFICWKMGEKNNIMLFANEMWGKKDLNVKSHYIINNGI